MSRPASATRAARRALALEIAVTSAAGARIARDCGADRVELCSALELGGVTPSAALVEAAAEVGLPVQVLVRCRPGGFVYDPDEIALMAAEVRSVIASGASGVVVGALTPDGGLDVETVRRLAGTALDAAGRPLDITLHRAIDQSADPPAVAALLPSLGLTRVLTSGGAAGALAGLDVLRGIVAAAPGVEVMAGGGVRPQDIPRLAAGGVSAVHLSAKRAVRGQPAGGRVPMGPADTDAHFVTDPGTVAAARAAVDSAASGETAFV